MDFRRKHLLGVLAALAVCALGQSAFAGDQTPACPSLTLDPSAAASQAQPAVVSLDEAPTGAQSADPDKWRFELDFYNWAPSLAGKAGIRGHDTEFSSSFVDILQKSDSLIGIAGRLEVGKGPWTGYVDGVYTKIGVDNIGVGPLRANIKLDLAFVTGGLYYRVGDWTLGTVSKLTLDVGPAGRFMHLGGEIDGQGPLGFTASKSKNWGDPLGAAQVTYDIDKHWQILFRGDAGAGMSDFTCQGTAMVAYRFPWILFNHTFDASVNLGYQAIFDKYRDNGFKYDATAYGPVFYFGLNF